MSLRSDADKIIEESLHAVFAGSGGEASVEGLCLWGGENCPDCGREG